MSAEDFFSRWSRRKREATQDAAQDAAPAPQTAAVPPAAAPQQDLPAPTMEDVARLDGTSDFARFMRRDVDESVKRSAMKKLFSDPHFNVMDGLDIYIDDYNKFEPLPAAMVALLEHAKPILNPPVDLAKPAMAMLEKEEEKGAAPQPAAAPDDATGQAEAIEESADEESEQVGQRQATPLAEGEPQPSENSEAAQDPAAQAATQSPATPATPEDGNPIQSL
jgi:hypothetical protein